MPSVAVNISPDILVWVLNKIVDNQRESEIVKLIKNWQSGEETPTFKTIETVSQKTHIPFGYFFLQKPPKEECELIECRTIDSKALENPSRELIDTVDMMSNVQEWMAEYKQDNGFDKLSFVGSFQEKYSINELISDVRNKLEIKKDWFVNCQNVEESFKYLREKISDLGILVMQNGVVSLNNNRRLDIEEFRAFTLINKYAPLIFINSNDTKNGKIFSLLHELVHIWIGKDNLFNNNDHIGSIRVNKIEQLCNEVAAEILVPMDLFMEKWNETFGEIYEKTREIAQHFKCSNSVIARRALIKNLIDKKTYEEFLREDKKGYEIHLKLKLRNSPESKGGSFYNTLISRWDKKFTFALDNSTKTGRTQYIETYRIVQMSGKTFHTFVDRLRKKAGDDF